MLVIGLSAETLNVAVKLPVASARYVLPYILPLVGVMNTPLELKLWPAAWLLPNSRLNDSKSALLLAAPSLT